MNFPKTLPGFLITANFFQDTALREINLVALPSICLLSSVLFFQEHFVTFPLFMNSRFSYMKNMYLFALITAYYEGFLSHLLGVKPVAAKRKKTKSKNRKLKNRIKKKFAKVNVKTKKKKKIKDLKKKIEKKPNKVNMKKEIEKKLNKATFKKERTPNKANLKKEIRKVGTKAKPN